MAMIPRLLLFWSLELKLGWSTVVFSDGEGGFFALVQCWDSELGVGFYELGYLRERSEGV